MKEKQHVLAVTWVTALLAFLCCALWGSAFSAVKKSYSLLGIGNDAWADQLTFGGLRFAVAGIMALIFGSIMSRRILIPERKTIPKICVISLFQTVLQYFCYYIGLAHTTGVKASVLVGANVFTAILISGLLLRLERITARKLIGSLIGFSGIVLINLGGLASGGGFTFIGDGMILLCTIASGFSSAFMKKLSGGEDTVLLSGWQFLAGGLVLMGIGLAGGGSFGRFTAASVALLLYLAFVSAAAYSIWSSLLKYNPVSRVAVFGLLNPICGVVISAIVLQETSQINSSFAVALTLVCAGIFIVNFQKQKKDVG